MPGSIHRDSADTSTVGRGVGVSSCASSSSSSLLVISLGSRRGVIGEGVDSVSASLVASPERSAVRLYILPVVELG